MTLKTSVVEILEPRLQHGGNRIFTSLEGHHPGGSIKDHLVKGELEALLHQGKLKPGDTVSEMSAGSTALSLSHYCREFGLKCTLFVPETLPSEFLTVLKKSAEVHLVPLSVALERYEDYVQIHPVHPFNQLSDIQKRLHYFTLADDISRQVGAVDQVVGAVGTGHSLKGVALRLRARTVSAEPCGYAVSGVRNRDEIRWGAKDPCASGDPSLFDDRQIISEGDFKTSPWVSNSSVLTSRGELHYCDSFSLVLIACERLVRVSRNQVFFLIGAKNRLVSSAP